jgi:rRNA processing protein Gar1
VQTNQQQSAESSDDDDDDDNDAIANNEKNDSNNDGVDMKADDDESDGVSEDDMDEEPHAAKTATSGADPLYWLTEDEDGAANSNEPPRTKNEVLVDPSLLVSANTAQVIDTSKEEVRLIGSVLSYLSTDGIVVIQHGTHISAAAPPLGDGSVVCLQDGTVMGKVYEVFGPVTQPYYVVRLPIASTGTWQDGDVKKKKGGNKKNNKATAANQNVDGSSEGVSSVDASAADVVSADPEESSSTMIAQVDPVPDTADVAVNATHSTAATAASEQQDLTTSTTATPAAVDTGVGKRIHVGMQVFTPTRLAEFITPASMQAFRVKGSDASNLYDEEVAVEEEEFSDDEQEVGYAIVLKFCFKWPLISALIRLQMLAKQSRNAARRQQHNEKVGISNNLTGDNKASPRKVFKASKQFNTNPQGQYPPPQQHSQFPNPQMQQLFGTYQQPHPAQQMYPQVPYPHQQVPQQQYPMVYPNMTPMPPQPQQHMMPPMQYYSGQQAYYPHATVPMPQSQPPPQQYMYPSMQPQYPQQQQPGMMMGYPGQAAAPPMPWAGQYYRCLFACSPDESDYFVCVQDSMRPTRHMEHNRHIHIHMHTSSKRSRNRPIHKPMRLCSTPISHWDLIASNNKNSNCLVWHVNIAVIVR